MEMQDIETTEDSDNWKKQAVVVVVVTSSLIDDQAPKNKVLGVWGNCND